MPNDEDKEQHEAEAAELADLKRQAEVLARRMEELEALAMEEARARTLDEVAANLRLSVWRVRRIEQTGLHKIRRALHP